jgi:predicted Zn-dependent protease
MLREDPQHASSWTTSGDLLLSQGDLTAAAEAYRTAINMDPNVDMPESIRIALNETAAGIDPMFSAAQSAENSGDLDSAINLLRFLIEREPQNELFLMATARVYWAQNNSNQAQNFLSRVSVSKRDWRGHILQAKLDITNKRFTQARTALMMASSDRDGIRSIELLMQYVDSKIATVTTDSTAL